MTLREQYFARVSPLLGDGLRERTVRAAAPSLSGRVIELLASCRLRRVVLEDGARAPQWPLPELCRGPGRRGPAPTTAAGLLARYLRFKNRLEPVRWLRAGAADATIDAALLPAGQHPYVRWDRRRRRVTMHLARGDRFSYQNVTWAVARQLRELLRGREAWPQGRVYHGSAAWPFSAGPRPVGAPPVSAPLTTLAGRHLLVVGCGSVGSEAIRVLAGGGARWTLVDGGSVSIFNPVRQWYGSRSVGRRKVDVLRRTLGAAAARAVPRAATAAEAARFGALLDEDPPDAVLLAAGTADHGALGAELYARGIPHVSACAYPQARFFEVSCVDPSDGTPCLSCFRGHLYRGRESAPALDDELANFLYCELDEEQRARAYAELVAEPASAIETSRVADVAAQCLVELLRPPHERALWMQRVMREGTTCLLGGNVVEPGAGGPAYGIDFPGQVVRLGLGDVVGVAARRRCEACGRQLAVHHRVTLPAAAGGEEDAGLLAG